MNPKSVVYIDSRIVQKIIEQFREAGFTIGAQFPAGEFQVLTIGRGINLALAYMTLDELKYPLDRSTSTKCIREFVQGTGRVIVDLPRDQCSVFWGADKKTDLLDQVVACICKALVEGGDFVVIYVTTADVWDNGTTDSYPGQTHRHDSVWLVASLAE